MVSKNKFGLYPCTMPTTVPNKLVRETSGILEPASEPSLCASAHKYEFSGTT